MKYNYTEVYKRINNLPPKQKYWVLGDVMNDYGLRILGDETKVGFWQFSHVNNQLSSADKCSIIMQLNLLGFSIEEIVLTEYLFRYWHYIKLGMQRTAPFHLQMKKEIKNLIDKVESGII